MKTLKDNVLLYDSECPMCQLYSSGFIYSGMLDKNCRMDYAQRDSNINLIIDPDRARNEIALVNLKDNTVNYGIFSLFAIIGNSFPFLNKLFYFQPFTWVMRRIYSFISYNRRVIVCGSKPESPTACNPDFSLKYRMAYVIFTLLVSSWLLKGFSPLLEDFWPVKGGWVSELLLVVGQIVFQSFIFLLVSPHKSQQKLMDYLGNLMTVSLIGSLLLIPALAIHHFVSTLPLWFYLGWFAAVISFMFFEHKRRVKVYDLPLALSLSWVGYRILVVGGSWLI
jgi:predicted DCC family thiol-disulfide oxidoreductase YuxK